MFPPGPAASWLSALTFEAGRNPLSFFGGLKQYGDLAHVAMGGEHVYLVSDPAAIRDVLMTHQRAFIVVSVLFAFRTLASMYI